MCRRSGQEQEGTDTSAPPVPRGPQPASSPAHMALKMCSEHKLPSSDMLMALQKDEKMCIKGKHFDFLLLVIVLRLE